MDIRSPLFSNLALVLAGVLFLNPIVSTAAQLAVDTSAGGNTSLGQAGNGVPLVNIATPNGKGLSHNKFTDYNVGQQGLILNNATERTQSTQLGGIIIGNPNLNGRAAGMILNEVTGSNASQLKGYTEVAGQAARVIVANPHGITCDGCGFINTPRVSLSTGKPVIANGILDRFDVDGGQISIEGDGINATNISQFDLITRSAKINAELQAQHLNVITGRNEVTADSLAATAKAEDGRAKPQLAIDSSALGGMYAGAIRLVGTEQGVGVRLAGNMAASGGDIQLDVNGKLSLAQTVSSGNLQASAESLDLTGPAYAAGNVTLEAREALLNQHSLAAAGNVVLSGQRLDNDGIVEAGVNPDNSRNGAGNLTLTSQNLRNSGTLVASREVQVQSTQSLDNQDGTLSGKTALRIDAGQLNNQQGTLLSDGQLQLTADALDNRRGLIVSHGELTTHIERLDNGEGEIASHQNANLSLGDLDNTGGTLLAESELSVKVGGQVTNQGGIVSGHQGLDIEAAGLDNSRNGTLASLGDVSVKVAGLLDNSSEGNLISQRMLSIQAGELNNRGQGVISSQGNLHLASDTLQNQGGAILSNAALQITGSELDNSQTGLIHGDQLHLAGGSLNNSGGELSARSDLYLTVQQLIQQQGRLISQGALHLDLQNGDLDNRGGLVAARGPLTLTNLHALDNREHGEVSSERATSLSAVTIDNGDQGLIASAETLSVQALNLRNAQGGLLTGWQGLEVRGGHLDNSSAGTLSSREGALDVLLTGALNNQNQGALVSRGDMRVEADNLSNSKQGILSTDGNLQLAIAAVENAEGGLIAASGNLEGQVAEIDNRAGQLSAGQDLLLAGTHLDNRAGQLSAQGRLSLELLGSLNNSNQARIGSGGPLLITSAGIDNRAGQVISQGLLKLIAGSFDNSSAGTLAAREALSLDLSGALNNSQDGLIHSQNDTLDIHAASLDNSTGTLQSQGDVIVLTDQALLNQGGRIQSQDGNLDLSASRLDNSSSGILSSMVGWLKLAVGGLFDNSSGLTQAQSLDIAAQQAVNNTSGHLSALANEARIETQDFDNNKGGLYANGLLTLTGGGFDNLDGKVAAGNINFSLSGVLNNQLGLIESDTELHLTSTSLDNRQGALRALGGGGQTRIDTQAGLDNRGGMLETANLDLALNVTGLRNDNGTLLHVGNGTFQVATANVIQAGGSLVSNGALTLNASSWANSSLLQAGRLTLNIGTFSQTDSGQLLASESLDATGGNWTNHGHIASDGDLNLKLSGTYSGDGHLTSLGDLEIAAGAVRLSSNGRIASGGSLSLTSIGMVDNAGRLTGANDFVLHSASLNNTGTLGGGGNLALYATNLHNEGGLIFSGGDMALRAHSVINRYADVYSLGALSIAANDQGGRASQVSNISGTLESAADFSISADLIENKRDIFSFSSALYTARLDEHMCVEAGIDCSGPRRTSWYELTQRDRLQVTAASRRGEMLAGGDMSLLGGGLVNEYSLVSSGGSLSADLASLSNIGLVEGEIETTRMFRLTRASSNTRYNFRDEVAVFNNRYWYTGSGYTPSTVSALPSAVHAMIGKGLFEQELTYLNTSKFLSSGDQRYTGTIQAGEAVNLNVEKTIELGVVKPRYTHVALAKNLNDVSVDGAGIAIPITLSSQLPPNLQQQQVNPLALPGFSLPQSENGLFRLNTQGGQTVEARGEDALNAPVAEATLIQPQTLARVQDLPEIGRPANAHKYLIETNPALTDLKQFMGSDYLLGNLGVDPDLAQKRLGDGLYEQRLIREAVLARTGTRYLDGMNSDEDMFRYLMDNAIASKDELNLSVGVGLTAEQVAALTHDIVWLEEHEIMGEKVLVPVLYLAQADGRLMANGALIQGQDVTLISGGELNNQGTLKASGSLAAIARNIENTGLLEANERLQLLADESIRNAQAGIIAGRDVSLTALTGDVINERTVTRQQGALGNRTWERSVVDSAARIEASDSLSLSAGRDIANLGGVLDGKGDVSLLAGRDVTIAAVEERYAQSAGSRFDTESITQLGAKVSAGGNLAISAGNDFSVIASDVQAGQSLGVSAGNDVLIASAANESHRYAKSSKVTSSSDTVTQVSSSLQAGGDLVLSAANDLALVASQLSADGIIGLTAGQDIELLAEADESAYFFSKKRDGSFGRSSSRMTASSSSTAVVSSIDGGQGLVLNAGGDVQSQGAQLASGGTLQVVAGGDIHLGAAENSHSEESAKSRNGIASSRARGNSSSATTLTGTNLDAQDIHLQAGNDLTLEASSLQAGGAARLSAGQDINILSAEQVQSSSTFKESSKLGLSLSAATAVSASQTKKDQQSQNHRSEAIGSQLSAGSLLLESGRDTTIQGSTLVTDGALDISAGHNLIVRSAEHHETASSKSSSRKVGDVGEWYAPSYGRAKQSQSETTSSTQQIGSQIASLGGDITLSAGDRYQQTASDVLALDGDIAISGKQVVIEAGYDQFEATHTSSMSTTALGGSVSVPVVDAARSLYQLNETTKNTNDARLQTLAAATAAMKVSGAVDDAMALANGNMGIKVSVSLGNNRSSSTTTQSGQNAVGSTVNAAGNLSIVATGAGADSDINVVGSRLQAGGNAHVEAEGDIVLQAAKNTAQQESDNSSSGWSVGVGFAVGGTANGFTIDLAANKARGNADGSDVSWSNSSIQAGNQVDLISGGDTTLKGAVISGERVVADIGGDLSIESLQDTSTYESELKSVGVGVSVCLPPICAGASSVSASYNKQKIDSNYASVTEQSGIKAGDGGFDIRVEGHTDLKGAVIASNQAAVDSGLNTLDTGTLSYADIRNYADYDASSLGLSVSYSTGYNSAEGTDADNAPWGKPPSSKAGFSAGTPIALSASDSDSSITHSGISAGTLSVRNADGQTALVGLKRDVTSEQNGSNTLKPIFDLEEVETAFAITEAFVQESGAFLQRKSAETADAEKKLKEELEKPESERNHARIAELQQTVDDNATWGMGGAGRLLLTALSAGAGGNVTGGTGEMLQATAVNFAQGLAAQGVKQAAGDDDATRALLHAAVGCLGAAGQGGDCGTGALGGSGAVALNLLLDQLQGVNGSELTATEKEARSNLVASLLAGAAAASGGDAGAVGTAGRLETENNGVAVLPYALNGLAQLGPMMQRALPHLFGGAALGVAVANREELGEFVNVTFSPDSDVPIVLPQESVIAPDVPPSTTGRPIVDPEILITTYPANDLQKTDTIGGGYGDGGEVDVPSHTGGNQIVENGPWNTVFPVAEQPQGLMLSEGKRDVLESNKKAGNEFEERVGRELELTSDIVAPQITIKTKSGTRTRLDYVTLNGDKISCVECKASDTAPLTKAQKKAIPEIIESGGVVVGKGKPGVPGGTIIPPGTQVIIKRP